MTDKKIVTEDYYPEGAWAPSFRAGDEVEPIHVELFPGLKVVGANTKTAEKLRSGDDTAAGRRGVRQSAGKQADHNIDPAPDAENGEANEPDRAGK